MRLPISNFLTVQTSNFPLELKCPLCNNFFMDAMMIPCCQHSFCQKCIREVLITKGMCPKCSRRCTVGDLLPNLSLRQAIEHLLESQTFHTGFEEGIRSPSVFFCNWKRIQSGSYGSIIGQHKRNMTYGNCVSRDIDPSCKANPHEEEFVQSRDFQGENQPNIPEAHVEGVLLSSDYFDFCRM